ncbi:MAG: hypothetical protein AAF693_03450 [Bacteroidota bacterium]
MSQRSKNIKLGIVWLVLVIITVCVITFQADNDRINVAKGLFAVGDVTLIDEVILAGKEVNLLEFTNGTWILNKSYKADPQRVTVLFAILKQNRIRRKVANRLVAVVDNAFSEKGVDVQFLAGEQLIKEFKVVGLDGLTYFNDGTESYVVEIPGYRVDLAGIFELDNGGWRNPLVFDINWANLKEVNMIFPSRPDEQFDVIYKRRYYTIRDSQSVDSTKLTDFLDNVSLMYVKDYLSNEEALDNGLDSSSPQASIVVSDVGANQYTLTIYNSINEEDEVIGLIDSTNYAIFDFNMIRKVLRPKKYFLKK